MRASTSASHACGSTARRQFFELADIAANVTARKERSGDLAGCVSGGQAQAVDVALDVEQRVNASTSIPCSIFKRSPASCRPTPIAGTTSSTIPRALRERITAALCWAHDRARRNRAPPAVRDRQRAGRHGHTPRCAPSPSCPWPGSARSYRRHAVVRQPGRGARSAHNVNRFRESR